MKKTGKGLFLALALFIGAQAVGQVIPASVSAEDADNQLSIWGTYNSEKVLQNPEYNHNNYHLEAKLDVASATGAAESGQIIITTGDVGVNAYTVTTSNLTNENGDIYNGENVDVFFQHYIKISEKTRLAEDGNWCKYSNYEESGYNGDYFPAADPNGPVTSGYTPDAIIPQALSVEHKENFIIPNANQGITFDFNVPTGTPSGTYTGNFTLTIDGVNHTIPVTLKVWEYDISKTNGMNLWDIVDGYYQTGELTSNNNSIYYAYYDELLKYKLNAYHFNENEDDEVHWVQSLRKYWEDPAFNGVFLPDLGAERARMIRFFTEIGKAAIEDGIDYFSRIRFYHQAEDEPQMKNPSLVPQAVAVIQDTDRILNDFAQDIQHMDGFADLDEALQQAMLKSIVDMPQIVTCDNDKDTTQLQGVLDAYCPEICEYDTAAQIRYYTDNAERMNGEAWTYTCVGPWYPFPSYHTDDFLLGGRSLGWMRQEYGIDCYLMWACNQYNSGLANGTSTLIPIDPYVEPIRHRPSAQGFANGDGYIFYPMAKYGVDSPIGTLRLLAARDGQEDYDMICKVESAYEALGEEYSVAGAGENLQQTLGSYYEKIYAGVMPYYESRDFENVRRALGGLTEAAAGASKTMIMQSQINGGKATSLKIYSQADEVFVNGKKLEKQNGYYTYAAKLLDGSNKAQITYVLDGVSKSFDYYLIGKTYALSLTEEIVSAPELSTATLANNVLTMTAVSKSTGNTMQDLAHKIDFTFALDLDLTKLHEISFDITSLTNVEETVEIGFYYKNSRGNNVTRFFDEILVYGYETYHYSYDDIARRLSKIPAKEYDVSKIQGIILRFRNIDWNNKPIADRVWKLYNFTYTKNA